MTRTLSARARMPVLLLALLAIATLAQAQGQEGVPLPPLQEWRPPQATSSAPAPGRQVSADELHAALQRYAREPSVEQVIAAALAHAPAARADALASRARSAGWVPSVALRARRGQGVDLSHALADEAQLSTDDDLTLEAALTFDLDRVVFRSEEVALARQAQAEADARAARVRNVIALYFERRRLQLERDLAGNADPRRAIRIAELDALLNVFTNGAFGRMIAAARWKTAESTAALRSRSRQSSKPAAKP